MDFYEVLEVPRNADVATIEKAFRALSLKHHPDKANVSTVPTGYVETREEREAHEARSHERYVNIVKARDNYSY